MTDLKFSEEAFKIIGAAMEVHKELGAGLLEPVYQEALAIEFERNGIPFEREKVLEITYKGQKLSRYYVADFVCYDKIIIELKALDGLHPAHTSQVINYLKIANLELGLLVNFGANSLQYKRILNIKK